MRLSGASNRIDSKRRNLGNRECARPRMKSPPRLMFTFTVYCLPFLPPPLRMLKTSSASSCRPAHWHQTRKTRTRSNVFIRAGQKTPRPRPTAVIRVFLEEWSSCSQTVASSFGGIGLAPARQYGRTSMSSSFRADRGTFSPESKGGHHEIRRAWRQLCGPARWALRA